MDPTEKTGAAPPIWLAEALGKQLAGNYPGALLVYRRILSREPEHPDAWCNLGLVLLELGQEAQAREACLKALALAPGNPIPHCNMGHSLLAAKDFDGALACYHRALDLDPQNVPALSSVSNVLGRLGRAGEALEADERALLLEPDRAELHLNRGYSLMRLGRLMEAESECLRALELDATLPKAAWNLAYVRLLLGRYLEAWPHFGARLQIPEARANLRNYSQPLWKGEPFPGRTLLVWVEQGAGDTLQFARYLPLAKARGGRIVFQVYPEVQRLLTGFPGTDQLVGLTEALPDFDLQVPLLDLPALFQSTPEKLPNGVPYLGSPGPGAYAPPARLSQRLATCQHQPKVALVWAGSPSHADDARRSLDPALLAPLAPLQGIQWISLQREAKAQPPLPGLISLGDCLEDFSDTAYVLQQCDLVITVDTAVAHLAGAMALPALVLLPFFPDWRWLMKGENTPWYPTMRLYRQPAPGDWPSVIQELVEDLR